MEITPGVYVGKVSARIRDELWNLIIENLTQGQAVLTYPTTANEQGYEVRVHHSKWQPINYEGLTLIRGPLNNEPSKRKGGWSHASKMRKSRRRSR